MLMGGEGSEEDDLSELQAGREGLKILLHRLDRNLECRYQRWKGNGGNG